MRGSRWDDDEHHDDGDDDDAPGFVPHKIETMAIKKQ